MRKSILILLVLICIPGIGQSLPPGQGSAKEVLVRDIRIEGFVLGDKDRFTKIFKPYRNKHLSAGDMDNILHQVQEIYEREGYQRLVAITYQVKKHRLIYTVSMTS